MTFWKCSLFRLCLGVYWLGLYCVCSSWLALKIVKHFVISALEKSYMNKVLLLLFYFTLFSLILCTKQGGETCILNINENNRAIHSKQSVHAGTQPCYLDAVRLLKHVSPHSSSTASPARDDRQWYIFFELTSWKWSHETILGLYHSWSQTGAGTLWTRGKQHAVLVTTDSSPSPRETQLIWENEQRDLQICHLQLVEAMYKILELAVNTFLHLGWYIQMYISKQYCINRLSSLLCVHCSFSFT